MKQGRRSQIQRVNLHLCHNVIAALRSLCLVRADVEQPAWLGEAPVPPQEVIAARNGLLHLPAYLVGQASLWAPTAAFFSSAALDYDIDLTAPPPVTWLSFLDQIWPNDPSSISLLQEWFGDCLLPNTSLQKILLMVGPTRSGKGIICRGLRQLIGPANVAGPTLSDLTGPFGLQPLLGKHLAIIPDARLSGRTDQAVIVERLLSISGEDALDVHRKNLTAVTTKLPTRLMLVSNELPSLRDASGAFVGRLLVLQFWKSRLGQEDPDLFQRLLPEIPGIFLWAVEGLRRLRQRRRFQQPNAGQASLDQMCELSSPTKAFVEQRCAVGQRPTGHQTATVHGLAAVVQRGRSSPRKRWELRPQPARCLPGDRRKQPGQPAGTPAAVQGHRAEIHPGRSRGGTRRAPQLAKVEIGRNRECLLFAGVSRGTAVPKSAAGSRIRPIDVLPAALNDHGKWIKRCLYSVYR